MHSIHSTWAKTSLPHNLRNHTKSSKLSAAQCSSRRQSGSGDRPHREAANNQVALPPAVDPNAADKANLEIIRAKDVKSVAKRRQNLEESLKKGYATVYDQCLQEVQDKLKTTKDWETLQMEQSLQDLIPKIEKMCVGFDDHKQLVFNLVQSLKMLFLYMQVEKDSAEEYARNFQSLWDIVEAFGGSPRIHKGLVDAELATKNITNPSPVQTKATQEVASKVVKTALLISGSDKRKYRKLKDELANNYLLGTDQYPNTFDKTARILGNTKQPG